MYIVFIFSWVADQLHALEKPFLEIRLHLTDTDFLLPIEEFETSLQFQSEVQVLLGRFDLDGILNEV